MSQHVDSLAELARPARRVSLAVSPPARWILLMGLAGLAILAQSLFEPLPNHIQDLKASWQVPHCWRSWRPFCSV